MTGLVVGIPILPGTAERIVRHGARPGTGTA
jgi:hypothetical protein